MEGQQVMNIMNTNETNEETVEFQEEKASPQNVEELMIAKANSSQEALTLEIKLSEPNGPD